MDQVAGMLVAGTNITIVYDDPNNKLTINGTESWQRWRRITFTPGGNLVATNVQSRHHRAGPGEGGQVWRQDERAAWY